MKTQLLTDAFSLSVCLLHVAANIVSIGVIKFLTSVIKYILQSHPHISIAMYGRVLMEPLTWSTAPLKLAYLCSVTVPAGLWAVQLTVGERPPSLASHTFTKIDHHRAVLFGGDTTRSRTNDTYVLEIEILVWSSRYVVGTCTMGF